MLLLYRLIFLSREVVRKPKKRFVPPFAVVGNLARKSNVEVLSEQAQKKEVVDKQVSAKSSNPPPKPSTSGKPSVPPLSPASSTLSLSDDELCCVCKRYEPEELRNCVGLVLVKWAQCDVCSHWTHLRFCTSIRVLRRGSSFKCPCCNTEE